MELTEWLHDNDHRIEWDLFAGAWDTMQRRRNPFREEQIGAILQNANLVDDPAPPSKILDLGCGPGILGRRIGALTPQAQYYGVDGDPLMLAAMQHLVPGNEVHPLHVDLRATGWMQPYQGQFDAVVSLTALHWLSPEHLQQLYRGILGVLKPGGRLVVGDPYLPADPVERAQLKAFQDERMASEPGATWSEFWAGFFTRYPIEEAYTRYHLFIGYQEPFEGAEDGYSLSFYEESLTQAGFESISVFWMGGLRIVYGGAKPVQ